MDMQSIPPPPLARLSSAILLGVLAIGPADLTAPESTPRALGASTAVQRAGGVPDTCVVDGVVFEDCPFIDEPLAPNTPGGSLLGIAPDLSARGGGFVMIPVAIAPGQAFTANAVIENLGGLQYSETEIRVDFYLSPLAEDALLPENFLGSAEILLPVVTSASFGEVGVLVALQGQLPEIASGQYRLGIDIDVDDALIELNEFNNRVAAGNTVTVGGKPDLVPQLSGFSVDSPVEEGDEVTISSTVKNEGSSAIPGPKTLAVRYRAVPEGGDELGGVVLGSATVTVASGLAIAPGAARSVPPLTSNVALPAGSYQVAVDVDFGGTGGAGNVAEASELNNSRLLGALIVQPRGTPLGFPDYRFAVADASSPDHNPVSAGDRLFLQIQLADPGPNVLPNVIPAIRVVASADRRIETTDTTLREFWQLINYEGEPILTLAMTLIVPWPAGMPDGSYFIGVIADPDDATPEPSENNNAALAGSVTSKLRCAQLPTLGQAQLVFEQVFTQSGSFPGLPPSYQPVNGELCEGSFIEDFDIFRYDLDRCYFLVPYVRAQEHITFDLLPAMERACVKTLSGLAAADSDAILQAIAAGHRMKDDLVSFKAFCDGTIADTLLRRYCDCSNPDYLNWAPPPGPDQCDYRPFPSTLPFHP